MVEGEIEGYMPKKLDAELLAQIEQLYLSDPAQTYATLSKKFQVGLSSLERIGKQRGWSKRRDQQSSDQLIKQSIIVSESLAKLNPDVLSEFDQFTQRRLLRIVQKGLLAFEAAIDKSSSDNPRLLSSLASGLSKLIEVHLRLQPLTAADLVEVLVRLDVGPDEFLSELRQQKQRTLSAVQN